MVHTSRMAEVIRSIRAHVEVDSNKQTYTLDEEYDSLDEMAEAVREWSDYLFAEPAFGSDAYGTVTTTEVLPEGGVVTYHTDHHDGRGIAIKMRVVGSLQNEDGTRTYSLDHIEG